MKFQEFLDQVLPDKADQNDLQDLCIEHFNPDIPPKLILLVGEQRSGKTALENIFKSAVPNFKNTIITANEQNRMEGYVFCIPLPNRFYFDSKDIQDIIDNDQSSIKNFMTGAKK